MSGDRSLTTRSTVPLRSSRPRIVSSGMTFEDEPVIAGAAPIVLVEGGEHDAVVRHELHQAVGSRADRRARVGRAGPRLHDSHHEVDGERSRGCLQLELDRVAIAGIDRCHLTIGAGSATEVGIEKASERVHHIVRRELAAVVKQHAAAQVRHVRDQVRLVERLGKLRHHPELVVDANQRAEEELVDFLRRGVGPHARVEIDRGVRHRDDDVVAVRTRRAARSGEKQRREKKCRRKRPGAAPPNHSPASSLSSASSASACIGVIPFTSMARRRRCTASSRADGAWNNPS